MYKIAFILLAAGLSLSSVSFAAPNTFALSCTGNLRGAGGGTGLGTVVINAVNNTAAGQAREAWDLTVSVQSTSGILLDSGNVCEQAVASNAPCTVLREGPEDLVTRFYIACANPGDGFDTHGLPQVAAEAGLTLASDHSHGFFYCRNGTIENIELSDCK